MFDAQLDILVASGTQMVLRYGCLRLCHEAAVHFCGNPVEVLIFVQVATAIADDVELFSAEVR